MDKKRTHFSAFFDYQVLNENSVPLDHLEYDLVLVLFVGVTRQARAFASRIHKCSNCCIFNIICAHSLHYSMYIQIPS